MTEETDEERNKRIRREILTDAYTASERAISWCCGRKIERAIESYAETIVEHVSSHEQKRPDIEYLCEAFVDPEYNFASNYYDDALRTLCTTEDDLEYWLEQLDARVSNISLDDVTSGDSSADEQSNGSRDGPSESMHLPL